MAELYFALVSAVDYQACRIRVRLDELDGLETYWIEVPQRHTQGTHSRPLMPELDEQVAVLLDDEGVNGVYLGGIYSSAEPPPMVDADSHYVRFSDGTAVTYNRQTHRLAVDCVGAISITTGGSATIEAGGPASITAPTITLKGPTTVDGNLTVSGNVYAAGTVMDGGGNSNHHSH
jgi:phage baseplate assembly protein V